VFIDENRQLATENEKLETENRNGKLETGNRNWKLETGNSIGNRQQVISKRQKRR
jgi:hypothetical protein